MTQDRRYRRSTYIVGEEVCVSRGLESFSKEIPQMTETDEDHVADVGREQNVIGWILLSMVRDGFARGVLRGEAVFLVRAMAKLGVDGSEDLFRSRRNGWVGKSIVVVEHLRLPFTQYAVL